MEANQILGMVIIVASYFVGCISPATLIGKIHGVDIRKEGSGNPLQIQSGRKLILKGRLDVRDGALGIVGIQGRRIVFRNVDFVHFDHPFVEIKWDRGIKYRFYCIHFSNKIKKNFFLSSAPVQKQGIIKFCKNFSDNV